MANASNGPSDGEVSDELAAIRSMLGAESVSTRRAGLERYAAIAAESPARLASERELIGQCLTDRSIVVRQAALAVLERLVEADPEHGCPFVGSLVECVDTEYGKIQRRGAQLLSAIVSAHPESLRGDVQALLSVLRRRSAHEPTEWPADTRDRSTLQTLQSHEALERRASVTARRLLMQTVRTHLTATTGSIAAQAVEDLCAILDEGDPAICGGAAFCLGEAAARGESLDREQTDALVAQLDSTEPAVLSPVIWALGQTAATSAIDPLERVATEGPTGEIRSMAQDTAAYLAAIDEDTAVTDPSTDEYSTSTSS